MTTLLLPRSGPDQGFGDGIGGRRRLLPRLQRHHLRGQRGERAPLDAAAGADHAQEHPGHEKPPRDPQRQGEHLRLHAGEAVQSGISVGRGSYDLMIFPLIV